MKKLLLTLMGVSTMVTVLVAQAPVDLQVCVGKGYTLTSTKDATGTSPVTYQWYEDGEPLPDSNSASYTIAAGAKELGDYAYVRVASNADCPTGIASNTYTVRVRPVGAAGEAPDATCGCATGTTDCSGTCTTNGTYTLNNGACTGVCHTAYVQQYDQCGALITSKYDVYPEDGCWQGCAPTYKASCSGYTACWRASPEYTAPCAEWCVAKVKAEGYRYYNSSIVPNVTSLKCRCCGCNE
jgi:hypothetical protein